MNSIPFGVVDTKPLRGFPEGKTRIRMRNNSFVRVRVQSNGCTRDYYPHEKDGAWWPGIEAGRNQSSRRA